MAKTALTNRFVRARRCATTYAVLLIAICLSLQTFPSSAQKKTQQTKEPELGQPPPIPKLKKKPELETDPEVSPGDVISVNTSEVMIPVTVRDPDGRLVNDLTRTDFRVFEDGAQQPLSDWQKAYV